MEFMRAMVEPSYQFLVLRLRLLPIYGVVSVAVYLFFLIVLKAVKRRDVELLREYLPAKLGRIVGFFGRIARAKE
jgi:hypothetical protein